MFIKRGNLGFFTIINFRFLLSRLRYYVRERNESLFVLEILVKKKSNNKRDWRVLIFKYSDLKLDYIILQMEHNPKTKNYNVTTRRGRKEPLDISIIRRRLEDLSFGLNLQYVNLDLVVLKV